MKKIRIFAILGCLISLFAACVFTACGAPKLSAPEGLYVVSDTLELRWDKVLYAVGYAVKVDGDEKGEVDVTSYSLTDLPAGEHKLYVKALGDGEVNGDSAWSEGLSFFREEENGLQYTLSEDRRSYVVTGMGTASGEVTIPDTYRQRPVSAIGDRAFTANTRLTALKLGANIRSIGVRALYNCSYLKSIELNEGLESIGEYAFQSCRNLTELTIPSTVRSFGPYAFSYCRGLKTLTLSEGIASLSDNCFKNCSELEEVTIPASVKTIGAEAFSGASKLKSVTFAEGGQTEIGDSAFYNSPVLDTLDLRGATSIGTTSFASCVALKRVDIPDTMKKIGDYAFSNCTNLQTVTVGEGVESIGVGAFTGTAFYMDASGVIYAGKWAIGCKNVNIETFQFRSDTVGIANNAFYNRATGYDKVTNVTLPAGLRYVGEYAFYAMSSLLSVNLGGTEVIGAHAFRKCELLRTVNFGNNSRLKEIGRYAFAGCTTLNNVNIPASVTKVGTDAFQDTAQWTSAEGVVYAGDWVLGLNDEAATSVEILENTVGIADYAFYENTAITSVAIPETVSKVGRSAFYGCTALERVTLPEAVTEISDYLFYGCTALTEVGMGENVTRIGRSAFYKTALTSIVIPEGVAEISDYAFYKCTALESVGFPASLVSVGERAFYGCAALTAANMPASVRTIGERAFYNCTALASVNFGNSLESVGDFAFYKTALTVISLPDSLKTVGNSAFYGNTLVTSVTLGSSLERVGSSAFYGLELVETLTLPAGLKEIGQMAFRGWKGLSSVVLHGGIEVLGAHVFYGNNFLTFYCEDAMEQNGWDVKWNSAYRPVVWGVTLSQDKSHVVSLEKGNISNATAVNGISAPARAGYTFGGWATEEGGSAAFEAAKLNEAEKKTVLYAIWNQ